MSFEIFISSNGNDNNTGTESLPLKSLDMALSKIRDIKKNGLPDGGVRLILRDGTYFLDQPLILTEQDSGEKNKPIVYSRMGKWFLLVIYIYNN